MIGMTISFAGNPKKKAINITPSIPIIFPNGSRKLVHILSIDVSPMYIFANNHMISPAGILTNTALFKTNNVLSNIDLIITFVICGLLYGGNSNMNDDVSPFNIVFDNSLETKNVTIIPNMINKVKIMEPIILLTIKNIDISEMNKGNLPLHGTKEFVRTAISLSLGESIILAPITPTALQPNPCVIVSACFPHEPHFLKILSKLKAILGKYPKSSNIVNKGKNIAIGGSITATTQAKTL